MTTDNLYKVIENLYKDYYLYLKNFLFQLTKNEAIAADIIQDLFSKILTDPSMVRDVHHIKSWLIKAAKNTLLDYYKKKKPDLLKEENIIENLLINNQTPEAQALLNSQIDHVLSMVSKTERLILLAKFHYGYDYQEISELLNIPVSTIKSKVFRIRKQLAKKR
ncbi:putative RNA polymerase [Bacillus sp. TS-2]|nr:putative RNA polymerase [Bacillus sp. TS-2]